MYEYIIVVYIVKDIIERFVPESTDPTELNETLALSTNYVRRLIVRQLLPPIRDPVRGTSTIITLSISLLACHNDFHTFVLWKLTLIIV